MQRYRFWKLDAFTDGSSAGNPAGLVLLTPEQQIDEAAMQRLATEVAASGYVAEVAFATPQADGALALRYFSQEREVPFCGHATVAAAYHLLSSVDAYRGCTELRLETQLGSLTAQNRITADGCVYIAAPEPAFPEIRVTAAEAARALGLPPEQINRCELGVGTEWLPVAECGQKCLLVPLVSLDAILGCAPDYRTLRALAEAKGLAAVVLFSRETHRPERTLRTRVFPPVFGYLEDMATGSGNAALGHWLRRTQRWTDELLLIEQGPDRTNPNLISLRAEPSGQLWIGGRAVARIDGEYLLH